MAENKINLLIDAFTQFSQASASLESSYLELQQRADRLSLELEEKNAQLKQSLAEKERIESYLKNILQSLTRGVLVIDLSGSVVYCNRAVVQQIAVELEPGASLVDLLTDHPLATVVADALHNPLAESDDTELSLAQSGGSALVVSVSRTPVLDDAGRCLGITFILSDITRLRLLEEQNRHRERLSAMGEMAVELAHEIRNPLCSIELFATLLEERLPVAAEERSLANQISAGVRSLNNVISNMLSFTRSVEPVFEPVELNDLISATLEFVKPVVDQHNTRLARRFCLDEAFVNGDPGLLRQTLLNLLFNGMHALPEGGLLEVSTMQIEPGFVEIQVRDTGVGISPDKLSRIFDPFYTTRREGAGLGLLIVSRIVEQHHGAIQVESQVGQGTCFRIRLPLLASAFQLPAPLIGQMIEVNAVNNVRMQQSGT